MSKYNEVLIELRERGFCSLQELADATKLSVASIAANLGGLHDRGLVTLYGSRPVSLARYEGPDDDRYVEFQLAAAKAAGR